MADKKQEQGFEWVEDFRREQLKKSARNPGLAAIFSFFVMGMGQIYAGHIDRGVIFLVINAFCLVAGYSVYSGGLVYNWLMAALGSNGLVIACYAVSVIYILIWIYNIKDAYYLSIFSSFRDWFEVERVLLPSMGVPSDKLLSTSNNNPLGLIENKSGLKPENPVNIQPTPESQPEPEKEDENIINITADTDKKETIVTDNNPPKEEADLNFDKPEEEELPDSEAAGLVFMNYSSWKLFSAAFLVVVCAGAGVYYFNSDYSKESSLQLVKDFKLSDNNVVATNTIAVSNNVQQNSMPQIQQNNTVATSNTQQPVNQYPILMTQSQIDSYVDWRMKALLAAREKKNKYGYIYSEDESEGIPLIVSADVEDEATEANNEEDNNDKVLFVQGHKEAKLLKKNNTEDTSDKNSNLLYVSSDNETETDKTDDVQLIMTDENGVTDIQQPVVETKKVVVPNVDKIVLDQLNREKDSAKKDEMEYDQSFGENRIKENSVAIDPSEQNNKKEEKKNTSTFVETPEIRAALEKIKERGAYEFYRGNWEAALPFYFELLKYRRNAESFEMVGIIFEKMNKLSDAYDAYENAYELGMESRNNITRLGLIGEKLGKYEEAQKYLERAIAMSPKRADIILSYARCLDRQGESLAAAQVLAVLRDSTSSYAIKQAAEQGYQEIVKAHENEIAAQAEAEKDIQAEVEKAITDAIKKKK